MSIAQGPNGGTIEARVGVESTGGYVRSRLLKKSRQTKLCMTNTGSPILDNKIKKNRNYNPDWMLGLLN
jgi:hypothetical protein